MNFWEHHIQMISGALYAIYEACFFMFPHPLSPYYTTQEPSLSLGFCLTGFKNYSTQISETVPVNTNPEISVCWDVGNVGLISSEDALWGCHSLRHNFLIFVAQRSTVGGKFLVLLELPNGQSLLIVITPLSHWSAEMFSCPHSQNHKGLGSGDDAG